MNCNDYIIEIYNNKSFNDLLKKVKPVELQDDLKQEVILTIMNYPCDKIMDLHKEGNLLNYCLKILWNVAIGKNSNFYKFYKKNYFKENFDYLYCTQGQEIPLTIATRAKKILIDKLNIDANNAHESIIFQKYVELKSCQRVADYFNIPRLHVMNVVNKTKQELKTKIQ